jgi:hypothetical protein
MRKVLESFLYGFRFRGSVGHIPDSSRGDRDAIPTVCLQAQQQGINVKLSHSHLVLKVQPLVGPIFCRYAIEEDPGDLNFFRGISY